jgi:hypothetical protein
MRNLPLILTILLVTNAVADTQEFENEDEWRQAVSDRYTSLTFTEFPPPPPVIEITAQYIHHGIIFIDGEDVVQFTSSYLNDGVGLAGIGAIVIQFKEPMNWIAAQFSGVLQFELHFGDRLVHSSSLFGSTGSGHFGGVVTDAEFDQAILFRPSPPYEPGAYIDDLHFGPSKVPADLTHDAVVGPVDLGELLAQWGMCNPDTACSADLDDNGSVGPADLAALLAGWSEDCNGNGEFDHFELITAGDCNNSGLPDACDITQGLSLDCNANSVPDECELKFFDALYVLDDGTNESQLGISGGGPLAWLNHFTVQKGAETIDAVLAAWGVGPVTVAVWSDPNDDGQPHDAVLLTLLEDVPLTFPIGGPLRTIEIPPTYVGEAGESFYVGLSMTHEEQEWPALLDKSAPTPMQSWWSFGLDDIGDAQLVDGVTPGNWMIRAALHTIGDANDNGVPDDCR